MNQNPRIFWLAMVVILLLGTLSGISCKPDTQQQEQSSTQAEQDTAPPTTQATTTEAEPAETEPEETEQIYTNPLNFLIVERKDFEDPANEYRGLRLAHDLSYLPGRGYPERATLLREYGFGGAVINDTFSDQYLQSSLQLSYLNAFLQAMDQQDMRVWLYDEKGYPSGSAGDLTCEGHPEYEAVRLLQLTMQGTGSGQKTMDLPDDFVKVEYAYMLVDGNVVPIDVTVKDGKLCFSGVVNRWTAYVYCVAKYNYVFESNSSYPNILNRDAVARFIEVTYDTYADSITNFGDIVEAMFTDEPQLLAVHHVMPDGLTIPVIPYDYDIFDTFQAKYGYDLRPMLHLVYSGDSAQAQRVRAHFYAHVGDLVAENFFGQIQEWCEAHGTLLSGHQLLEENMYWHVPIIGNYFQCSYNMGYPGFDVLNVRPAGYLRDTSVGAKYASSAAWLSGKERVMIEICPVNDEQEFNTNHLDYALGAMTFAYFDGGNQVTSYYVQANTEAVTGAVFNTYIGRMGSLTVGAQNLSQIAIYYSIDAVAAAYESPTSQHAYQPVGAATTNDSLVNSLSQSIRQMGLDYVFVDDVALQGGTISERGLQVGNFTFTTILVPKATVMDIESMRVLDALIEAGVNVIFVKEMPTLAFLEQDQAEMNALISKHSSRLCTKFTDAINAITVRSELGVESNHNYVYVSPYEKNGIKFFFLVNNSTHNSQIKLSYEGAVGFRIYDPVTGTITEVKEIAGIQSYRALFVQPLFEE